MEKELDRIVCEAQPAVSCFREDRWGVGGTSRGTGEILCGRWVGGEEGDQGPAGVEGVMLGARVGFRGRASRTCLGNGCGR